MLLRVEHLNNTSNVFAYMYFVDRTLSHRKEVDNREKGVKETKGSG